MNAERLAPTRMNLLRSARQLQRVVAGASLLRRKREALVTELFKLARPAADARVLIAERTRRAYPALVGALAAQGRDGLRAVGWPSRVISVDVRPGSIWGIVVSRIEGRPEVARSLAARGAAPQVAGLAAVQAAAEFEQLVALLLEAAPREALIRRLGDALAQTSRQVHTLERRVAPQLEHRIATVRRTLDERERDERLRLKHLQHRSIS